MTKVALYNGGSGYDSNVMLELNDTTTGQTVVLSPKVHIGVLKNIPLQSGGLGHKTDLVNIFDLQNSAYAAYGARAIPVVIENGTITEITILDGGLNYDAKLLAGVYYSSSGLGSGCSIQVLRLQMALLVRRNFKPR